MSKRGKMQEVGLAGSFRTSGLSSLIECCKIVFGITDNLNFSDLFRPFAASRYRSLSLSMSWN
jgi:hypothetical protein